MNIKPTKDHKGVVVEVAGKQAAILPGGTDSTIGEIEIKTVLVPVDFSDCSRKAIDYAVAFARQFKAKLALVHVVQSYFPVPELGALDYALVEGQMRTAAEAELARLQKSAIPADIASSAAVVTGVSHREIVALAGKLEADLLVISTHGHTGLRHVLMGSTAEQVVRHAPCPVLVVREEEHEFLKKRGK